MSPIPQEGAPMPHLPPPPEVPGAVTPEMLIPQGGDARQSGLPPPQGRSVQEVQSSMNRALAEEMPLIEESPAGVVALPAGWINPENGRLIKEAHVRELNGWDEEKLSRLILADNPAVYVTEMCALGVESIGGEKPTTEILRQLLLGDRDALWMGIRIATYGSGIDYNLNCQECGNESVATIDLETDVPVKELEDPLVREFDVELRRGVAKVVLLNGYAQERFSKNIQKKTQAEINTILLANSVSEINGNTIMMSDREDAVRRLSSQDRAKLLDFIVEKQPGPQLGEEITVHCSTCNAPFPIVLSMPAMFRF